MNEFSFCLFYLEDSHLGQLVCQVDTLGEVLLLSYCFSSQKWESIELFTLHSFISPFYQYSKIPLYRSTHDYDASAFCTSAREFSE